MKWLGLTWDEGPEVGGDFGPYLQTQRFDTYTSALERLKQRDASTLVFAPKKNLMKNELPQKKARVAIQAMIEPAAI